MPRVATSEAAAPAARVAEKVRLFIIAGHSFTAGAGGTGRITSEAIFQSFAIIIQFMIIRNGFGVPS
jgi:hypothetical protein